jgi:hypothetical protein
MSVRLSLFVRMEQLGFHWTDFHTFRYLGIFLKICRENLILIKTLARMVGRDGSVGVGNSLRAERSGDRIPVGARFSAPVQTSPEAHRASYTMDTGSFRG